MRNVDKPDIAQNDKGLSDDADVVVSDALTPETDVSKTDAVDLEVYGANHCRYTAELLEDLEWRGVVFTYYDVDKDADAKARFIQLTENGRSIPVLVENGKVTSVGYQGRSCLV